MGKYFLQIKPSVLFGILFLMTSTMVSTFSSASELKHTYKKSETLWFLSQVYYGKGNQYPKIMEANGLKSPDGIEDGKILVIKDFRFGADAKFLAKRYQKLSEKREKIFHKNGQRSSLKTIDLEHPARTASQELGN